MQLATCVDLFAGLGGNTEAARLAGLHVKVAVNHWAEAVRIHQLNHPGAEHLQQDLQQANFYDFPDFDLLLASPACQGHSIARGKDRPHHDNERSTAWAVVSCAEDKRPKAFVVENVPEFRTKWQLYPLWRSCLEQLGYHVSEQVLNAADCGVPQERRRLFVVGVHKDLARGPVVVPPGRRPHMPASTIIDWEDGKWSPIMKAGRAARTIRQFVRGRAQLDTTRFLMPYYGSGSGTTGRSLDRPLGTLTTKDRYAVVDDKRMRMLTPHECLLAQGFRRDYRLTGVRRTDMRLIGNAVPPPLMAHVIARLLPC